MFRPLPVLLALTACVASTEHAATEGALRAAAFVRPVVEPRAPLSLSNPDRRALTRPLWGGSFEPAARVRLAVEASAGSGLVLGDRAAPDADEDETVAVALVADTRGWALRELRGSRVVRERRFDADRSLRAVLRVEPRRVVLEDARGGEHGLALEGTLPASSGTYVTLAPGGTLAITDVALSQPLGRRPELGTPLRELARGRSLGTATDVWPPRHDARYEALLAEQFDTLAVTDLYWPTTRGEDRDYQLTPADLLVNFASVHHQKVHGYFLTWDFSLPKWLESVPPGQLGAILDEHIDTLVGRYRGRVDTWLVANEAILGPEDNGGQPAEIAPSIWTDALGPEYLARAFRRARASDPSARLVYNETGAETLGPKADFLFELVKRLKGEGVPIDAVGFQAHLHANKLPDRASFRANLERFAALGVDVAITELDVSLADTPGTTAEKEQLQARAYRDVIELCQSVPRCTSFTVFGFSDNHAWDELGDASPLVFDKAYRAKPAFFELQKALRGRP